MASRRSIAWILTACLVLEVVEAAAVAKEEHLEDLALGPVAFLEIGEAHVLLPLLFCETKS